MTKAINSHSNKSKTRIFIVDDHPLVSEGLTRLLNLESDLTVVGQAATVHQASKTIPALKPDLAIIDIALPDGSGIDLIKDMKRRSIKCPFLVLSMHDESLYAERALRAGAKGYIMKHEVSREILKAIHRILDGNIYVSEKMGFMMLEKVSGNGRRNATKGGPTETLSDREFQVFQMIGRGRGTRQIAGELNVSVKTVETYRANIKNKMDLKNAPELARHAVEWVQRNRLG